MFDERFTVYIEQVSENEWRVTIEDLYSSSGYGATPYEAALNAIEMNEDYFYDIEKEAKYE